MPNPVPMPSVPVPPKSPVPVPVPNAVPVPNPVGFAPNRPPVVLVVVPNALVPRPPVLVPKLNPVWGLFCCPNNPPVVPVPKVAKDKDSFSRESISALMILTTFQGKYVLINLINNFSVLKKCRDKSDCLIHEMLIIQDLKPALNVQTDSILAKLFT